MGQITAKVKLYPDDEAVKAFRSVCDVFSSACDFVSKYMFDTDQLTVAKEEIQTQLYYFIRGEYGLKSQMACSVFRVVKSKYKTIETQYKENPYTFECEGKEYSFQRDLSWLRKPVSFKKPFVELVRGHDWSFVTKGDEKFLSINTLSKRVVVPYNHYFDELLFNHQLGSAKLLNKGGNWYLHISVAMETESDIKHIVGHDRGLRFVVTSYDGENTTFVNGCDIAKKRNKYYRTRRSLQKKNTRGAHRVLKRISGRENRWMNDVNHCLSKTLITPNTLHVIENLTNVSRQKKGKNFNRELSSWSFYDLEQKMTYKAELNGGEVVKVPSAYTSQRCPKCGHIHKANRRHKEHLFKCRKCGYTSNDDRIGAMNLYELGIRYLEIGKPKGFSKR